VSSDADFAFTSGRAVAALDEACAITRLDAAGADLIRFGQNATYRLKDQPYVVRIARAADPGRVRTEVRVARWLADAGFPAIRLADISPVSQPFEAGGRLVTVWDLVETSLKRPTMTDLAPVLRGLHGLAPPPGLELGSFEPFRDLANRLARAPSSVPQEAVDFLHQRAQELGEAYASLSFELPTGPIHGDAHPGNLMRSKSGAVVLGDLECFAVGPREWDVALAAAYRYGFGWLSDSDYRAFTEVYGYDVARAPCFQVLRAIREVNMTAWLMQNVDESDAVREEFGRRMADLRSPAAPRTWRPF
jgi:aminoglycoside phosphotransferase (APT) family kinase protein